MRRAIDTGMISYWHHLRWHHSAHAHRSEKLIV